MSATVEKELARLASAAMAYRTSKPLLAALHYDLFTLIEEGHSTPEALARRRGLDAAAVGRVLAAVAANGWLRRSRRGFANTPAGRRLLVSGTPDSMASNLRYQEYTWDAWSELREVMRRGRPRVGLRRWIGRGFFTDDYIKAMGDVTRRPARELASKLGLAGGLKTLDVGSGAGTFSAAFADRSASLRPALFDLPRPLAVARGLLSGRSDFGRFEFREGNYLRDALGREEFDLVLVSNVLRVEDERTCRMLVRKAWEALRPGGRLAIHDYAVEGRPSEFAAGLDIHLLVFTGKGAAYTAEQYRSWLRDAGFSAPRSIPIGRGGPFPSLALVGTKPAKR